MMQYIQSAVPELMAGNSPVLAEIVALPLSRNHRLVKWLAEQFLGLPTGETRLPVFKRRYLARLEAQRRLLGMSEAAIAKDLFSLQHAIARQLEQILSHSTMTEGDGA